MTGASVGRYTGFGCLIDADRPILGGSPVERTACPPDMWVRWHPPRAGDAAASVWSGGPGTLDFSPPGIGLYRCSERGVDVYPTAGAADDMVDALLVATALPAALWQRGAYLLHAAAVVPHGWHGALAIAGPPGAGKSTLAAMLLDRGARLVADDCTAIRLVGGAPICSGLAGGYHLEGAAGRRLHRVAADQRLGDAPLHAVIVLDGDPSCTAPARPGTAEATGLWLAHRHRASVPRHLGQERHCLLAAALLATDTATYRWPRSLSASLPDWLAHRAAGIREDAWQR